MVDHTPIDRALEFVARSAIAAGIAPTEILKKLLEAYEKAVREPSKPAPIRQGSFVEYWDPKLGACLAHVLEVQTETTLRLRVHRTAQNDFDVKDAPFSAEPAKGHWYYRASDSRRAKR